MIGRCTSDLAPFEYPRLRLGDEVDVVGVQHAAAATYDVFMWVAAVHFEDGEAQLLVYKVARCMSDDAWMYDNGLHNSRPTPVVGDTLTVVSIQVTQEEEVTLWLSDSLCTPPRDTAAAHEALVLSVHEVGLP